MGQADEFDGSTARKSGPDRLVLPGVGHLSAAVLVLAVMALCAVPGLLRRPDLAVGLFAFLLVLHANLVLSRRFDIDLADPLLFGMMLALAAVYPLLHGDNPGGSARLIGAYVIWLAAVINSFVWSTASGLSVEPLQAFLPNIMYSVVLFLLIFDSDRLVAALIGVVAACFVLSTLTIIQLAFRTESFDFFGLANGSLGHIAGQVDAVRPTGPVFDPNYYCQILIPGFGIAMGTAAGAQSTRIKVAGVVAAVVIGIAILLTASRGGMLAAVAAALFVLYSYRRIRYLAFLLPPLLVTLYFVPAYSDRVLSLARSITAVVTGQEVSESSVAGRLAEMQAAAILFAEHPITGIGYGMFESRYQDISANYDLELRGEDRAAHSLYLETAAEQGLIGLAALLVLLGSSLRALQQGYRFAVARGDEVLLKGLRAIGAASVGLFASSVFLHDAYAQHFWLVLALLFASERVSKPRTERWNPRVMIDA